MIRAAQVYQISSSSIVDEFQRYHIPNTPIQWYELEPTFGFYAQNISPQQQQQQQQGGKWKETTPSNSKQQHYVKEPKMRKKIGSNSAYALFFHEKQGTEKKNNPMASFGQISQQIAKQWELLSDVEKMSYKSRCEKNRKNSIANAVEEKARQLLMKVSST